MSDERRLPPEIPESSLPERVRPNKFRQQLLPRAPLRAIKIKGDQLRAAVRQGHQLDWDDIHERFVDLWQEARHTLWRAKHQKAGLKTWDPHTCKEVLSFTADDKLVLQAIDTVRGILDSMIKLRREMGHEATGIPRWAIERIEKALRGHPEALNQLLKELAAENDKAE